MKNIIIHQVAPVQAKKNIIKGKPALSRMVSFANDVFLFSLFSSAMFTIMILTYLYAVK